MTLICVRDSTVVGDVRSLYSFHGQSKKIINLSSRNLEDLEVINLELLFKLFFLPLWTHPIAECIGSSLLLIVLVTEKFSWLGKLTICRVCTYSAKWGKSQLHFPLRFLRFCFRTLKGVVSRFWQIFPQLRPLKSNMVILTYPREHWEKFQFEIETLWKENYKNLPSPNQFSRSVDKCEARRIEVTSLLYLRRCRGHFFVWKFNADLSSPI